jgi:uncharacterized protein (DUF885 family)
VITVTTLADELLDLLAEEDPLNDLMQGYAGYDDLLGDLSEAAHGRLRTRALDIAAKARELPPDADPVTAAVVVQQAGALAVRMESRLIEHTMLDITIAPLLKLLSVLPTIRAASVEQERNFLSRLAEIPEYLAAAAGRHRGGVAAGRLPVRRRVAAALTAIDDYLANPAGDPLRRPPLHDSRDAERDRLLADVVRPAFRAYRQVLSEEIAPHSRDDDRPGLCWLPGGEANYVALAHTHTTTRHTPEELHRIGLDLLERLDEEYATMGSGVFGPSTAEQVRQRMRADPAMRWDSAEAMLASARATIHRAEQAAPRWFGLIPAQRCGLDATPSDHAPHTSAASYLPGALDGSRAGTFYLNTYRATERDRWVVEANAFHEAVPGHHFQITLAQHLTELPALRRFAWINSYFEGWALYCERLADEIGLYSGDVARLGMLANDSLRAARLVVDTGLHAFGWSRDRVVDFLREKTVMNEVEVQQETDRYIEDPGQALSYMVGRLEIQRLRATAEAELGDGFDIRAFHDLVLGGGPLPMDVLDDVVRGWIATAG